MGLREVLLIRVALLDLLSDASQRALDICTHLSKTEIVLLQSLVDASLESALELLSCLTLAQHELLQSLLKFGHLGLELVNLQTLLVLDDTQVLSRGL